MVHPPPAPPRKTNLGLAISRMDLSNGLRVVLVQDPKADEVHVTMRYRVGAVDDPAGQEGVAHLVEHLMFQQSLGSQSLFAHIEDITSHYNGITMPDSTTYFARANPSHLDELLSIEAVRMGFRCTSISDSTFEREREVVVNELRQRGDSFELARAIHAAAYPDGHPYTHAFGGSPEIVAAITFKEACAFADAHYAPENAVLVVSGNITPAALETSLRKFIARIAKRPFTPAVPVPPVRAIGRQVEAAAPIDRDAFVIAWPLPSDLAQRARVQAVARVIGGAVDDGIAGTVRLTEIGDERAPMIALFITPGPDEKLDEALAATKEAISKTPDTFADRGFELFGRLTFDRMQQGAIYSTFARLEDEDQRDAELARYVLDGRDPTAALGDQFQGLRELSRREAAQLAREHLSVDRATVVLLRSSGEKRGRLATLDTPVHDLGQRRDAPDPAAAHAPAPGNYVLRASISMRTRQLPNGMKVVLLPVSTVPTVDMRLVFASGSADELPDHRGAALLAGHTLSWDWHTINDELLFTAAGGSIYADVGWDRTTFEARGLDMNIDLLLAGLRRYVREGKYRGGKRMIEALRREAKKVDDEGELSDAWRAAIYGERHPYVGAGIVRHTSPALSIDDAPRFRDAHFTPDNATLVISGRFDPDLVDQWIDYLFADWHGTSGVNELPKAAPHAASIAQDDDTAQLKLAIAIPAAGTYPERIIVREMLAAIANDVRHQLGATYGLSTSLDETRAATNYVITGYVDSPRTKEALALLQARFERLRSDPEAAAREFIVARSRALTHLTSLGGADAAADQVELDVSLQRDPLVNARTVPAVQSLTIDRMTAALASLDLAHAVIVMRGRKSDIDAAFAVLGRTATYVQPHHADPTRRARATHDSDGTVGDDDVGSLDFDQALTDQGPASRYTFRVIAGYAAASLPNDLTGTGLELAGCAGYRFDESTSFGFGVSLGRMTTQFETGLATIVVHDVSVVPVGIYASVEATTYDRFWGAAHVGLEWVRTTIDDATTSKAGLGAGLVGGIDALKLDGNRIGGYASLLGKLGGDHYAAFTVGVAYRR